MVVSIAVLSRCSTIAGTSAFSAVAANRLPFLLLLLIRLFRLIARCRCSGIVSDGCSGCDCDCSCDCACSFNGCCDSPSSVGHCASSSSVADCPATSCPAMSATSDPTAFSASDCCVDSGCSLRIGGHVAAIRHRFVGERGRAAPVVPASIAIVTSNAVNFPIRAPHRLMKPASGSFIHFMTCPSLMALRRIAYAPPCLEPYG